MAPLERQLLRAIRHLGQFGSGKATHAGPSDADDILALHTTIGLGGSERAAEVSIRNRAEKSEKR